MIDFFMKFETMDWILSGLFVWLFIRVVVVLVCSEEVNDYIIVLDIVFLCLIFTSLYFNSNVQQYLKPTEHQRLNQMVGVEGFEPSTSPPQTAHSAKLSYTP